MLSDLAIRLGQTDRAAAVLEQALDRFPQGAVVLGGLAALRHHQMRLEDAVAIARASIAISPVHFEVHGRLADCLTRLGREAEAETVLRAMITRFPKIPTPYQQLGRICIRQDRLPEAEEWLQNAVTLDPDFIESRTQLANVLIRLQRPSDAEAVLRGSRAVDESAELLLALANLRATAGNVEEAIAWASKAAAAPLHNLAANRFVWDQLVAMPDLPRAAEFLLGQIARGKHLADLTLLLARTYRHMEQHEQAMQCYRQAAEAMEQNSRLLREYVDYLLVIGQEAVARRFVARRQAMFPNDALVRLSMGIVLLRTNEREAARREFEIASQLDPHDGGIARYLKMTEPVEVSG
jgi:tetratricopeptide (TPR) repeat protein